MKPIVLDTHTALWGAEGVLSSTVMKQIDDAAARGQLLISPITAWEIGMLAKRRRIELAVSAGDYVEKLYSQIGAMSAPLTPTIAVAATELPHPFPGDPADRMIAATAIAYEALLYTRDRAIITFAKSYPQLNVLSI